MPKLPRKLDFSFYDETNKCIYVGKKSCNKIHCLNYDSIKKSIQLNDTIKSSLKIYSNCRAPNSCLDKNLNQIVK